MSLMFLAIVHSSMSNTGLGSRMPGLRTARPSRYSQGFPVASGVVFGEGNRHARTRNFKEMDRGRWRCWTYQLPEPRKCRLG